MEGFQQRRHETWHHGYNNLFLCEYYPATGDKSVLPAIRSYTTTIARGQGLFGTWGHGYVPPGPDGQLHGPVPPYGPVNATGLPCFISLVLAEKCGIQAPGTQTRHRPVLTSSSATTSAKASFPMASTGPASGTTTTARLPWRRWPSRCKASRPRRGSSQDGHRLLRVPRMGPHRQRLQLPLGTRRRQLRRPAAMAAFMKELRWYYDLARRWEVPLSMSTPAAGLPAVTMAPSAPPAVTCWLMPCP